MGDAIMAFWGAPVPDRAHARRALQAAREMLGALVDLAPRLRERGWPELTVGIGINTGVMRVGHMGSEFRQAYTVMGDAVNLGARIEGLTKLYGVSIAVGEATAVRSRAAFWSSIVRVQGRTPRRHLRAARKLELPARTRRMREQYAAALAHYRRRDWDAAERAFFLLHQADLNALCSGSISTALPVSLEPARHGMGRAHRNTEVTHTLLESETRRTCAGPAALAK
jgi:adenylate cyclase